MSAKVTPPKKDAGIEFEPKKGENNSVIDLDNNLEVSPQTKAEYARRLAAEEAKEKADIEAQQAKTGITIPGLGNLDELANQHLTEEELDEGEGGHLVVLSDVLTGANGVAFRRSNVVRASKLSPSWSKDKNAAASELVRLLSLNAVRVATSSEAESGIANLDIAPETVKAQEEINRLQSQIEGMEMERELETANSLK